MISASLPGSKHWDWSSGCRQDNKVGTRWDRSTFTTSTFAASCGFSASAKNVRAAFSQGTVFWVEEGEKKVLIKWNRTRVTCGCHKISNTDRQNGRRRCYQLRLWGLRRQWPSDRVAAIQISGITAKGLYTSGRQTRARLIRSRQGEKRIRSCHFGPSLMSQLSAA